jgi:hypothetical protein
MTTPREAEDGSSDDTSKVSKQFVPFFESLTQELAAIRNRVRLLVRHWPTDGHFKESIFRQVLRRHLPTNVSVGTGFVVNYFEPSGEIDVLVTDNAMPTLFREGELVIVTPESVRAVIEVKTSLNGPADIEAAAVQLAKRKAIVERHCQCDNVWAGLFVYEGNAERHEDVLTAIHNAWIQQGSVVNAVTIGEHLCAKFFPIPSDQSGMSQSDAWHSFDVPAVAPASFIAALIEALAPPQRDPGSFAWFQPPAGFRRRYFITKRHDSQVEAFLEKSG